MTSGAGSSAALLHAFQDYATTGVLWPDTDRSWAHVVLNCPQMTQISAAGMEPVQDNSLNAASSARRLFGLLLGSSVKSADNMVSKPGFLLAGSHKPWSKPISTAKCTILLPPGASNRPDCCHQTAFFAWRRPCGRVFTHSTSLRAGFPRICCQLFA